MQATLKIQKNWRATKLRTYASVAKTVMQEVNQLFASLRQQTHQVRAIEDFSFLKNNLQLQATKVGSCVTSHSFRKHFVTLLVGVCYDRQRSKRIGRSAPTSIYSL